MALILRKPNDKLTMIFFAQAIEKSLNPDYELPNYLDLNEQYRITEIAKVYRAFPESRVATMRRLGMANPRGGRKSRTRSRRK